MAGLIQLRLSVTYGKVINFIPLATGLNSSVALCGGPGAPSSGQAVRDEELIFYSFQFRFLKFFFVIYLTLFARSKKCHLIAQERIKKTLK